VLATGSPALAEAAERLESGDAYAAFLHPAPSGGATGAVLRVSLLDCRGEGVDHLRGVVLVAPDPDLRGLSYRELRVLGIVVEDWPDECIGTALDMTGQEVAECVHRSVHLLAAPHGPRSPFARSARASFFPDGCRARSTDPTRTRGDLPLGCVL
jgi:hypothetical protein